MRLPVTALSLALVAACATTERTAANPTVVSADLAIFRAAELARVRCLVVAPFENASNASLAAEAATGAVFSSVSATGARVFPVKELRALFRDTPVELPEGVSPGLAMELAQLVGADAAIYGTVEGTSGRTDPGLVVSLRLALSPARELLYARTFGVTPRRGESIEAAVRRSLGDETHEMFLRLGGVRGGPCFDRKRLDALRAIALAQAAPKPPPATPPPAACPTPPVVAAVAPPVAPAPPIPPVAPPPAAATAAPAPRTVAVSQRQKEFAHGLRSQESFLVEDVSFAGRTAQLQRDAGLADLAIAIGATPDVTVTVEGHVDATNDVAADSRLSLDMAKSAADRLVDLGVPRARLKIAGRGSDNPRLPNFTARGRAANRRIEAYVAK